MTMMGGGDLPVSSGTSAVDDLYWLDTENQYLLSSPPFKRAGLLSSPSNTCRHARV